MRYVPAAEEDARRRTPSRQILEARLPHSREGRHCGRERAVPSILKKARPLHRREDDNEEKRVALSLKTTLFRMHAWMHGHPPGCAPVELRKIGLMGGCNGFASSVQYS